MAVGAIDTPYVYGWVFECFRALPAAPTFPARPGKLVGLIIYQMEGDQELGCGTHTASCFLAT